MSSIKWNVVKRNGDAEPYAEGRMALAVFRAAQAQRPPVIPSEARKLANAISQAITATLRESGSVRFDVEQLQDYVVAQLHFVGCEGLAESYQTYRELRQTERGNLGPPRKIEKGFKFIRQAGVFEVEREIWARALGAALERGASPGLDVASWWGGVKELAQSAKTFDEFAGLHIRTLLERSDGRDSWLMSASALLIERWSVRLLGLGPLISGKTEVSKALRARFKSRWSARRASHPAPWLPNSKEIDTLSRLLEAGSVDSLGFSGLSLLERTFGHGDDALMPQEVLLDAAIALCFSCVHAIPDAGSATKLNDCSFLSSAFFKGTLIPPLNLMRQARLVAPSLAIETHLHLDDSMESIFEALASAAGAGKSGAAVSVDLSMLRAEGSSVGGDGQASGGITPVLRLFGEVSGMLRGRDGEKQKARLSLACWHRDLESFLAYGKLAPKELRLSLYLPDAFMRRVFEGGDWILASPSEAPQLAACRGADFERWVRDYAQMAKFGGLGAARCASAREVFDWICQCIAGSGSPSIVFSDACVNFARPAEQAWITARMSGLACKSNGPRVDFLELGMRVDGKDIEAEAELMARTRDLLARRTQGASSSLQAAVAPVGMVDLNQFRALLTSVGDKIGQQPGVLPSGALWAQVNPYEARWRWLEASRGGYLERGDAPIRSSGLSGGVGTVPGRKNGPTSLLSLSAREEYLWLADVNPIFVDHAQYRRQVWFEGVRAGFGGSGGYEPIKKQIKRASGWQGCSDGALALDVRLNEASSQEVAEAIKLAWLHGLVGVRRFVGRRVDVSG